MKNSLHLLLLMWLIFFTGSGVKAQNFDLDLLKKLNVENPQDDKFWMGVTNSIKWVPAAYVGGNLIYGLVGNDKDALRYSLESGISIGIAVGLTTGVKELIHRPRPTETYPNIIHTYPPPGGNRSFPSGHTAFTMATATTASFQINGKWYWSVPVFTYPIGVGYSRMRLGRHYPTDVLVGALIGIGSGILGHWITGQIVH